MHFSIRFGKLISKTNVEDLHKVLEYLGLASCSFILHALDKNGCISTHFAVRVQLVVLSQTIIVCIGSTLSRLVVICEHEKKT